MAKISENSGMGSERRRKSKNAIADKKREVESRDLSKKLFVGDFAKFLETESQETGRTPAELVDEIINSSFAIVQFSESTGKASLVAPTSWGNVAEKNPNNEDLLLGYREMRENFAPVSAGIEWHKGFTIGGGFTIQIEDSKDAHQKQMKELISTFVRQVYQDELTKGLFAILDIMMDIAATDGCAGAEIVYGVETKFEDYITGYEDVEMPDTEKVGRSKIVKVPIFKEPIWQSVKETQGGKEVITTQGLDGITRLKIIDNSVMRLTPYRHPKSGEILFWTIDEKVKNQNVLYYATQETMNANPTKLLPWEVFWLTWSRHSTNLKGVSQIKPIYSVAKFVQDITKAIGIGLNRWANKKYFFVCGTDKRPWGKPHQDQFLKAMEQMIKQNWIGIPTPAGFDIKEIGGENSIFDGSNLLSYLTGMICSGMNYPREFLEAGKTQASDKAWLAWTVTYGHTQVQIKHAIESQLFERHIWCTIGKDYTVPKKGVSEEDREKFPVYVPRVEWKAEGQWLRNDKMKTLKSILDAANPADAPLKLSIEKEMATTMGLGEVDFSVVEDLLNTETKNRLTVSKQNNLLNEAKLEALEKMKKDGTLTDEIMTKLLAPPTEQKPPATQPDQQTLEKRGEKRLEGGVDRTNRDKDGKKGQSKEMGGTRLPYHETSSTVVMEMPPELAAAMVETEKLKQEQLKTLIEKAELIKKLKEKIDERKTIKKVNENER